ncbi:MAG: HNH endonuclease [Cyanosarcina radialis HA8281-LM2]|jgi:hypothetical protein|nr:HNH endonuclease [Cyanosarcina radialis HA8281-LM2]
MNPYYTAIAQRANHRCEYCKPPEVVFNFPFEVEHIIPLSWQGSNDEANLALAYGFVWVCFHNRAVQQPLASTNRFPLRFEVGMRSLKIHLRSIAFAASSKVV